VNGGVGKRRTAAKKRTTKSEESTQQKKKKVSGFGRWREIRADDEGSDFVLRSSKGQKEDIILHQLSWKAAITSGAAGR